MKIFSASRREDMPAFRVKTLVEKFREKGEDAFWVLWTKDPRPLLREIGNFDVRRIALQLTVTGLGGTPVEPGVPSPAEVWRAADGLVAAGVRPELVGWRLDPVIPSLTARSVTIEQADRARDLGISRCTISFVTAYGSVKSFWSDWQKYEAGRERQVEVVKGISQVMQERGIELYGCAQPHLSQWLRPARCIDGPYYEAVTGFSFQSDKDSFQRKACGCTVSHDIGAYRQCPHGCLYCYARPEPAGDSEQLTLFQ